MVPCTGLQTAGIDQPPFVASIQRSGAYGRPAAAAAGSPHTTKPTRALIESANAPLSPRHCSCSATALTCSKASQSSRSVAVVRWRARDSNSRCRAVVFAVMVLRRFRSAVRSERKSTAGNNVAQLEWRCSVRACNHFESVDGHRRSFLIDTFIRGSPSPLRDHFASHAIRNPSINQRCVGKNR